VRQARAGVPGIDLDRKADTFWVPPTSVAHTNPVRAYVTVMEGCNHVCSFCVVPRTRGPEVNRRPADIVAEVESLTAQGVPEVMLLGQTVNAYEYDGQHFSTLLERVHAVPGLRRLRFTTSHPEHVDARLAAAFRDLPKLCPYLHLPVQSGSDRILTSMRRGYTAGEYREKLAMLREAVPHLALSSDIIVGYPGETEADFEATLALVEEQGFESLFVFTYSPRPGTTAFRIEDDVPEAEKRRRLHVLNHRQQRFQAERNASRVGSVEDVLVESVERERPSGRTADFKIVHIDGPASVGESVSVQITSAGPNALVGNRIAANNSLTVSSSVPIL
jgi:tRNA-2-methylthio-N6-dimethylallyladenosine synthase